MKIAYFGYDLFSNCLEALINKGHTIIKVFSFPTDNEYDFNEIVTGISKKHNIEITYNKPSQQEIYSLFKDYGCDTLLSAGYIYKIPVLDEPFFKGINIHPAYLPNGRGVWPFPHFIFREEKYAGITIHKLAKSFDTGDILIQEKINVEKTDDLETLIIKSRMLAEKLVVKVTDSFEFYYKNAKKQQKGATWNMPTKEEMTITGDMTVNEADKIARAFGKSGFFVKTDTKEFRATGAAFIKENHALPIGKVIHSTNKEKVISLKDGFIVLKFF